MKRHVRRLILLLLVGSWLPDKTAAIGQERTIEGEEKVATLVMLEILMEANYRKIETWTGLYDLRERLYSPNDGDPAWRVSKVVVAFTVDAKTDRVRSDYVKAEPSKLVDRETGEDIPADLLPAEYRTIRSPEHYLHFSVRGLRGHVTGFPRIAGFHRVKTRVVYRRIKPRANTDPLHVNPLTFFGPGYRRFSVTCSIYAKWLLDENSEVRRKNTTTLVQRRVDGATEYALTIRHPSDDGAGNDHVRTIVFSSAAGFNPLSYEVISLGRREVEMNWAYRKYGEILLPSRHEIRRYNWASKSRENEPQDEDADLVRHRIFELRECSLNQPVDSRAFELAGLGLKYGDRMVDEIERKLHVYDGEKLVPAKEFTPGANRQR